MSNQTKKIFRNTTTVWLLNTWSLYTFLLNPDMVLGTCERSLWKHISAYSICVWYIILHSIIFLLQVLAYLITVECMHWHCERCIVIESHPFATSTTQNKNDHSPHTLTSVCWVHSNEDGLGNSHCIRYLTAVDPFLSTSSTMHKYHHLTPGSEELPLISLTRNPTSIGKVPVS